MHEDRDDCEDEEQVNEEAGDVQNGESADPENDQDKSNDKEHGCLLSELECAAGGPDVRWYKP
jgi:hypothetical protein